MDGAAAVSLLQVARDGGLVYWGLPFDLTVMTLSATALAAVAAWAFSKAA
jgi:hypothetical protein